MRLWWLELLRSAFQNQPPLPAASARRFAAKSGQFVRLRRVWGRRGMRIHVPHATRYQWGYLHEAMEVDGANKLEMLFTPCIDQVTHLSELLPTLPPAWALQPCISCDPRCDRDYFTCGGGGGFDPHLR